MAIGAYTTAILLSRHPHLSFVYVGVWVILSGAIFGLLIGIPTLRLKGDYLAIASLGFGEIVKNVLLNADTLTGGPMGISLPIKSFDKGLFLGMVWLVVCLVLLGLIQLQRSHWGRGLEAIREDELAAQSVGLNTPLYKGAAFMIGAAISAMAGMLWALYHGSAIPQTFDSTLSIMVLCMVVLGGLGNYYGSLFGTMVIVVISELPRLLGFSAIIPAAVNQILFGIILVSLVILRQKKS